MGRESVDRGNKMTKPKSSVECETLSKDVTATRGWQPALVDYDNQGGSIPP